VHHSRSSSMLEGRRRQKAANGHQKSIPKAIKQTTSKKRDPTTVKKTIKQAIPIGS
jgi:hypothetical protein